MVERVDDEAMNTDRAFSDQKVTDQKITDQQLRPSRRVDAALAAAIVTGLGVWIGQSGGLGPRLVLGIAIVVGLLIVTVLDGGVEPWRVPRWVLLVLFVSGLVRSDYEWKAVTAVKLGPYHGEAILRSDPRPKGRGAHAVVEIAGQRFDVWAYGPNRTRLSRHRAGEVVIVQGHRRELAAETAQRRQLRHVMGRFEVEKMMSVPAGTLSRASPLVLAAHRLRVALGNGARTLLPNEAALFAGLVYGDDTAQPQEMIDRFRRSGLAHLTAVSGQNVAYMLTMAAPLLTRLRRPLRLALTMVILGWFVILTRHEASVIRASMMAAVGATVFAVGRRATGGQILSGAATAAFLVDPFLAWSVGWWLSMSGAAGLIFLTPAVVRMFTVRPKDAEQKKGWVGQWVGPMCAAQMGVLPVSALVFGVPSAWAIPCNLLAVPVAGAVMLVGLPVALLCGFLPTPLARVAMWPLGVGVRWVDTVAGLGARLRLPAFVDLLVAGALCVFVLGAMWYHQRERRVPT